MSVIHRTTLQPTKLELLASWLPSRPWYRGDTAQPKLTRAGGFRLDDPEGEVGIEFMVVEDASTAEPTTHLVPLTYRGAPLDGAEHALLGTAEHGVLGRRWIYDGCHDPVLVAQVTALLEGRAEPQAQSISNTPDHEVTRSFTGTGPLPAAFAAPVDTAEHTDLTASDGTVLRVLRILTPAAEHPVPAPTGATGHITGAWDLPDGTRVHGVFFELR
ncbi:maltokinase N-terminal cap-like domain-containing protein [Streptomyces thermodiastaticus]